VPIEVISKRLGHSDISIAYDRYITVYRDRDAEAPKALARIVAQAEFPWSGRRPLDFGLRGAPNTRKALTDDDRIGSANGNRTPPLRSRPIPSIDENAYSIRIPALRRSNRFRPIPRRFDRSVTDL